MIGLANAVGHGVDVLDINRFSRICSKQAARFLHLYFTKQELASASKNGKHFEKLASRFAIKEAVLKALGLGWGDGVAFTDVEVVLSALGAPSIVLHRKLIEVAVEKGIKNWLISASHSEAIVFASAIAVSTS
jgi:holo-[acyl-carrier protein] synthase